MSKAFDLSEIWFHSHKPPSPKDSNAAEKFFYSEASSRISSEVLPLFSIFSALTLEKRKKTFKTFHPKISKFFQFIPASFLQKYTDFLTNTSWQHTCNEFRFLSTQAGIKAKKQNTLVSRNASDGKKHFSLLKNKKPYILFFEEKKRQFVRINFLVENRLNGEFYRPNFFHSITNVNFTLQISKFTARQHILKTFMNLGIWLLKNYYTCSDMKEKPLEL